MKSIKIFPSMLAANLCCLGDELRELSDADGIHWDIMDGNFVEQIAVGSAFIRAHREVSDQIYHVHLMVDHPFDCIADFANAGADIITVHVESDKHIHKVLEQIRSFGKMTGVALNPATPPDFLPYVYDLIDSVTIMTVNPGRAGQSFLYSQLHKIQVVSEMVPPNVDIIVDGGINEQNIGECVKAGAHSFVVGSCIFRSSDYSSTIKKLKEAAEISLLKI